ncbi:MAG: hypothetical protein RLZZ303_745 [Candidatus Hydrogenedentota bacterium]
MRIASEQLPAPSFNVAPGVFAPVIRHEAGGYTIEPMIWGLVPRWAKSLDSLKSRPINARSETADTGAMFRDAFRTGRCIVPAIGFYEWQGARPPKQPWFISARDQDILAFAGLCAHWRDPGSGEERDTFAILTTEANEAVHPIHDRMPCILHPGDEVEWLDGSTNAVRCKELLAPYPASQTTALRVSTAVNKVGVDSPTLIQPIDTGDGASQGLLF